MNTYPLIHVNFLHGFLNVLALTPLLERFESEHGTLTTAALLAGRKYCAFRALVLCVRLIAQALSTLPGGLYLLFERGIWRGNNAIMGARYAADYTKKTKYSGPTWADHARSEWVFVFLAVEAMKAYRTNPYLTYAIRFLNTLLIEPAQLLKLF